MIQSFGIAQCNNSTLGMIITFTFRKQFIFPFSGCDDKDFLCVSDGRCIPRLWLCDQDEDCSDGSDEADCTEGVDC